MDDNHQFDEHDVRSRLKDERMDQLEIHIKKLLALTQEISSTLIGSILNGNKGLVQKFDVLEKDVESIKKDLRERDLAEAKKNKYIGRLESILGILLVLFITAIFKLIFKL
jgi:hypothetical protein